MYRLNKDAYLIYIVILSSYSNILCIGTTVETKFHAYWNSPTIECRAHIDFRLSEKYNIIQNTNDEFIGNRISLIYSPGDFPALLKNDTNKELYYRNGGIPQNGNVSEHLEIFYDQIEKLIPNNEYNGLAILDFESWRPIYQQNFGSLQPYRDMERKRHPKESNDKITALAKFQFETAAREFFESTIILAKIIRPYAQWGYYQYPLCYNQGGDLIGNCSNTVAKENDEIKWLFESSDTFYPLIYLQKKLSVDERQKLIKVRITETQRVANTIESPKFIIPYFWYKFQDNDEFLTEDDIRLTLTQLKESGVNGVIFWGSSNDVNSKERCLELHDYVEQILGPILNEIVDSE